MLSKGQLCHSDRLRQISALLCRLVFKYVFFPVYMPLWLSYTPHKVLDRKFSVKCICQAHHDVIVMLGIEQASLYSLNLHSNQLSYASPQKSFSTLQQPSYKKEWTVNVFCCKDIAYAFVIGMCFFVMHYPKCFGYSYFSNRNVYGDTAATNRRPRRACANFIFLRRCT